MLGAKRLASMPDRVTNTINVVGSEDPVCRPTVINQYSGDLSTMDKWWAEWQRFMFKAQVKIRTKTGVEEKIPYQMLKKILNSKYESITLVRDRCRPKSLLNTTFVLNVLSRVCSMVGYDSKKRKTRFPCKPCVPQFLTPFWFT